jgi:hypothetical protein
MELSARSDVLGESEFVQISSATKALDLVQEVINRDLQALILC